MYYNYSDEELRAYCRNSIESLEMWARRLIHEKMVEKYGTQYINYQTPDENYIIKKEIREQVQFLSQKEPHRILRHVDALFLDHLIYFLCKPEWYKELFKEALDFMYPEGQDEVHTFLERLVPIRNALSHSNPISVRQAEQAICYSNDFIDSIKHYYKEKGLEQVWNVPRIIRVTDSLGNIFENPKEENALYNIFTVKQPLHCGDKYSVQVEIDSSFPPAEYDIIWEDDDITTTGGTHHSVNFLEKNVSENYYLYCKIVSHKSWHKYKYYDCQIAVRLTVLPPLE